MDEERARHTSQEAAKKAGEDYKKQFAYKNPNNTTPPSNQTTSDGKGNGKNDEITVTVSCYNNPQKNNSPPTPISTDSTDTG